MKAVTKMAAYWFCLIATGLSMLLITPPLALAAFVWPEPLRGRRVRAIIHWYFRACMALYRFTGVVRGDLSVLDAIANKGPMLIVANHPSLMDALLVISRLPDAVCIMKSSLSRSPFLGVGARLAGYIPNDSAHGLVRLAIQRLREGSQLVVFPEGTRSRARPMTDTKGAFATIARRAGVPMQLVVIDVNHDFLSKGWPLWRLPALPVNFDLRLSRVLEPTMSRDELVEAVEQVFAHELARQPGRSVLSHAD
mgnify:CR=1 FL=1